MKEGRKKKEKGNREREKETMSIPLITPSLLISSSFSPSHSPLPVFHLPLSSSFPLLSPLFRSSHCLLAPGPSGGTLGSPLTSPYIETWGGCRRLFCPPRLYRFLIIMGVCVSVSPLSPSPLLPGSLFSNPFPSPSPPSGSSPGSSPCTKSENERGNRNLCGLTLPLSL